MGSRFTANSSGSFIEGNIYADKASLILYWLLTNGVNKDSFSLREISKDTEVSIGLVQKTLKTLILHGTIESKGVQTSKRFFLKKPNALLQNWIEYYSIIRKCKMHTYRTGLESREELLKVLRTSKLNSKVAFALHSAAEAFGCKNTNLSTLELYMLNPEIKVQLEKKLELEPQERGYEVLLIEPYYKSLLHFEVNSYDGINTSPSLLTFLDLYHFPLRGTEQAEFMAERLPELKQILKRK